MMLFGGFGFLMTFLKRHGFSSIALTMIILKCNQVDLINPMQPSWTSI